MAKTFYLLFVGCQKVLSIANQMAKHAIFQIGWQNMPSLSGDSMFCHLIGMDSMFCHLTRWD